MALGVYFLPEKRLADGCTTLLALSPWLHPIQVVPGSKALFPQLPQRALGQVLCGCWR